MRAPVAVLLTVLAACAATRVPLDRAGADPKLVADADARSLAVAGLRGWVVGGDRGLAESRVRQSLARDPRDPWAHTAAALLAQHALDESAEVKHLIATLGAAPSHPLAALAASRLQRLADGSLPVAKIVETGLAPVQSQLAGIVAARVRAARAAALAVIEGPRAADRLRQETAPVSAWTLAGPFGALHALEFDVSYPPERGLFPRKVDGVSGLPPIPARSIPTPEGLVSLEGEPGGADLFYLSSDVQASRGGAYLLSVRTNASVRVWVDGVAVLERRVFAAVLPSSAWAPISLAPGRHQLLVKLARGVARGDLGVALPRADGGASDLGFTATEPGTALVPVRAGSGSWPEQAGALATRLAEEAGHEVAALLVASEERDWDPEGAKALLRGALRSAPGSAALLAADAQLAAGDTTVSERAGRARAEAELDRALALDPSDGAIRIARAERMLEGGRIDDAAALLEPLATAEPPRPAVLLARARIARARNLPAVAERLAEEARRIGGGCGAVELLFQLPTRRTAVAKQDDDAEALARCRGGLEALAEHRQRRGDVAGALAAAEEVVRASPARLDARFARAGLLAAAGRPAEGAADLASLAAIWPRDARIEKRRAELLEASGDRAGAQAARERALLLDPADLSLRRALGLERLQVPLDDAAEDGLQAIARYRAAAPRYDTSSVTVLDFGAAEVHPGGAYTERIHTVIEARDQRAVDHVGEVTVPEGAELLLARTVKRDGSVLEAEEPLGDKRSLSLTGLEPGDFAEWEWIRTVPSRGAAVPGFTMDSFFFAADMPLWRSTYVVSAPASVGMEVDAHGMDPVAPVRERDRLVLRHTRHDVPPLLPEPDAPADPEQLPFLQLGSGADAETLARAIGDALVEAYRPNLELRAFAEEIRAAAGARADVDALVRAAYRKVDERILGGGGFDEPATVILSRGSGNRTMVLKAVLGVLGVPARIALVREFARDPAPYRFARPDQWAYAVLRVERGQGVAWLDPTTRRTGYGVLPPSVRGAEAIVIPESGERPLPTRIPAGDSDDERRRATMEVTLDAEGTATIDGREEYRGYAAASLRAALEQLDATSRRQMTEHALARSFRGPELLSVAFDGEGDPEAALVVRYRARIAGWARVEEGHATIETPILPARLGSRFLQLATRRRPLLIAADERSSLDVSIRAPDGWTVVPTAPVEIGGSYGAYRRREWTEAGVVRRLDGFDLHRTRILPTAYPEFAVWARSVDAAQRRPIVFERFSSPPGAAAPRPPSARRGPAR